jgi:hypothetical protein
MNEQPSKAPNEASSAQSEAESSASTQPTVVAGLGYPAGRNEQSVTATGWQGSKSAADGTVIKIED